MATDRKLINRLFSFVMYILIIVLSNIVLYLLHVLGVSFTKLIYLLELYLIILILYLKTLPNRKK